jgi:beta-glucanase (GH16 family)
MPSGSPDDWELLFSDDFDRDDIGDDWGVYSGSPGGDPYSQWDPGQVRVADGLLTLHGSQDDDGQWLTGGVSNWPVSQTYGKWEVRFRADPSDEITFHFLLWPKSDEWPPEIDFLEDFGGDRTEVSSFLHYRESDGDRNRKQWQLSGTDFSQWHTAGVEWMPGSVKFLVDGEVWAETSDQQAGIVPDEPMWLGLQAQSGGCQRKIDYGYPDCPVIGVPDTADVQIDWVAVYAPESLP